MNEDGVTAVAFYYMESLNHLHLVLAVSVTVYNGHAARLSYNVSCSRRLRNTYNHLMYIIGCLIPFAVVPAMYRVKSVMF